jgi:hypothetical protein
MDPYIPVIEVYGLGASGTSCYGSWLLLEHVPHTWGPATNPGSTLNLQAVTNHVQAMTSLQTVELHAYLVNSSKQQHTGCVSCSDLHC